MFTERESHCTSEEGEMGGERGKRRASPPAVCRGRRRNLPNRLQGRKPTKARTRRNFGEFLLRPLPDEVAKMLRRR